VGVAWSTGGGELGRDVASLTNPNKVDRDIVDLSDVFQPNVNDVGWALNDTTTVSSSPVTVGPIQLNDIVISVKTTGAYHGTRVDLQLKTWFTLASDHTYIFTDVDDAVLSRRTNNHVINTKCPSFHSRDA
jgi:hypothetical protein